MKGHARRRVMILALGSLVAGLGADREVVRVRVPAGKVAGFFPEGVDLKVMPIEQFEDLLKTSRARADVPRQARVIRAGHSARWDSGVLTGRSELVVDREGSGLVILEPWSPAIVSKGPARATEDGRLAVLVEKTSASLDWLVRSRVGSEGRAFALAFPDVDVSCLTLDLPVGLVPEGPWEGPGPGPSPERRIWRRQGIGKLDLRLRVARLGQRTDDPSMRWLDGPTRIDLTASPSNWRAEWVVEDLPDAPERLTIDLDPGLELIDVEGPRVRSFRVESRSRGDRVSILLDDKSAKPSPVVLRGLCRVPVEGIWSVPSARPVDATWTGGRTSVRLDTSRILQSSIERAGRRVGPGPGDPTQPSALVFEPTGQSGPVADLTFRKPTADASVEVRGRLQLDDVPRMAVNLSWTVDRGRLLSYSTDLPPGWTTDRVVTPAGLPITWHSETLSSGGSRVHMNPAAAAEESPSVELVVEASNRQAGTRGPIDLPRVRPSTPGLRVADETWVATTKADVDIRPTLARGLAWLDPTEQGPDQSRTALAWRWLADDAEARVDRSTVRSASRGDVRLDARVTGDRVRLAWSIVVEPAGHPLSSIPIYLDGLPRIPIRWRVVEPAGVVIESRPLSDTLRVAQGFPTTGSAWDLHFSSTIRARVEIEGIVETPWTGPGSIPILGLPTRFVTRGMVAVDVPETSRSKLGATGLTPVDLSESSGKGEPAGDEGIKMGRHRRAGTFAYRSIGGHLTLETIAGQPGPSGGVIREATLTTQAFPGSGLRHRLALRVVASEARSIRLGMPPGVVLDRLRRDGQAVNPRATNELIEVEITAPTPGRPSSVVTLEYRTEQDISRSALSVDAILPYCSMPCLSFSWEVTAPDVWKLGGASPGLVSTDPRAAENWSSRLLGFRSWPWTRGESRSPDRAAMLLELDRVIEAPAIEDATLGERLLKLDAGRWPVVVDRLSTAGAGLGPMSRLGSTAITPNSNPTTASMLATLGLVAMPVEGMILITNQVESSSRRLDAGPELDAWRASLRLAATTGADPTDRFQSAARWRGEPTPRLLPPGDSIERVSVSSGWLSFHLTASGWPGPGASIRLVDERSRIITGWLVATFVAVAGLFARRLPARVRSLGLGVASVVAAGLVAWSGTETSPTAIGLIRGILIVLPIWLVRSIRPTKVRAVDGSDATTVTRRTRLPARSATLGMALALIGLRSATWAIAPLVDRPLVALIPYEGTEITAPAKQVVLRLDDFENLERRSVPPGEPTRPGPTLTSILHQVRREELGAATVESLLGVEADGPASWTFPVGTARDLSATVDGQAVPIQISPDGASATVAMSEHGSHNVAIHRVVPLVAHSQGCERIRLPINRSAFARVDVSKPGPTERVEVGGPELGPVSELEVTWHPTDEAGSKPPTRSPVDATILWDVLPVGDLARVRLSHSNPDGLATLRLALHPGVVVRGYRLPGLVSVVREGMPERPDWIARFDPPVPPGVPMSVDLWQSAPAGDSERSLPGFAVLGTGRLSGIIGLRRSPGWSGRLEPQGTLEAIPDAEFDRSWGGLPDDGLMSAGAMRFVDSADCRVATGLSATKRSARTTVTAELNPGRIDATIGVVLEDRRGRSFELDMGLPLDFRVIRVEATGLVDWQKATRDRLRLQFDGSEIRDRSIVVRGYVPVPADPVMGELRSFQGRIPWPRMPGVDALSGSLVIGSTGRFQMDAGEGIVTKPAAAGLVENRQDYQVDRPDGLGPVRWSSPSARVVVTVRSHLAVDPGKVSWTAVVDCNISGGPADLMHWRLPAGWAKDATLEVDGVAVRPISELKGEVALWTIRPETPIWGQSRLVLRSSRPIVSGEFFEYPDVAPLASTGRGSVTGYDLTVSNLSGRPIEFAGSPGLQPVATSPFQSGEMGPVDRAYHVSGERWSLRLRVGPRNADNTPAGEDHLAGVTGSQLSIVVRDDGETWGRARYYLEDGPSTFLEVALPPGSDLPWAAVDGSVTTSLREANGRWLIPLADRGASRVQIVWHRGPSSETTTVAIPVLNRSSGTTLVAINASRSVEVSPAGPGLRRLEPIDWDLAVAEDGARRIDDTLADLDRASARDREGVVDDIVDFELRVRSVERRAPGGPTRLVADRVQAARSMIDEAGQVAGLDDLIDEARSRVGLALPPAERLVGPVESSESLRLRRVGESRFFASTGAAMTASPLSLKIVPVASRGQRFEAGIVGLGGLAASMGVWFLGRSRVRNETARRR